MLTHYLTIGWRNLRRNPLYSFINILGLSIGVAACLLIFLFVQDEYSYDACHVNSDRIVRMVRTATDEGAKFELNRRPTPFMPMPMGPAAVAEIPGVESMVRILQTEDASVTVDTRQFGEVAHFADGTVFDVFSFSLVQGDASTALSSPNSVVLSKKLAKKFFGTESALGRAMQISVYRDTPQQVGVSADGNSPEQFQVTGILEDHPSNSTVSFDMLLPIESSFRYSLAMTRWSWWRAPTYLLLKPGVTPESVAPLLSNLYQSHLEEPSGSNEGNTPQKPLFEITAQPLRNIHFDPETGGSSPLYSYVLGAIAVAVLFIACVNFITLAMARSMTRAREVSVRKVFGAVRAQLVSQFLGESLLLTFSAAVVGLVLAEVLLPVMNQLSDKELTLNPIANPSLIGVMLGLFVLLSVAAGSVPAFILARLQPAAIFYQRNSFAKNSFFARGLIVLQYSLSIALVICMLGMFSQQSYIRTRPLGFDADQVIVVSNTALRQVKSDDLLHRLRAILDGNEQILSVAAMSPTFTRGWDQWEWRNGESSIRSFVFNVDPLLLPTLGLQLVAGRNFTAEYPSDKTNSILINETMARTLNLADPVGQPLPGFKYGDTLPPPLVIGVVKDFHILSLHESIEPALLHMSFPDEYGTFLVRVKGDDLRGAVTEIEKAWVKIAGAYRFDYTFLDQDIANQYLAEQRWFSIVTYATLLAAIIASLGLFGLAGLSAVRRMKEVGIRKVLGASLPQLLENLNREFLLLVGVANLIAWPLAYLVLNQWLQSFAYRTELSVWIFILSGLSALVLALAVISYHTVRTASINPSEVLRHE